MSTALLICPGCHHKDSSKWVEATGQYNLYTCTVCELTYSDPMRAASADFYEANTEYDDKWEFGFLQVKMRQLGLKGSLLDIGCGDGRFIEMIRKQFAVTGLDLNRRAVQRAESERQLTDVHPMTLEEFRLKFPSKRYDVITFFHFMEHMEDPNRFLSDLKQCLKPSGIIAVSVPNPNRWTLYWTREVWDYPPHHLTRWTRSNLCALLESQGFAVMEIHAETVTISNQVTNAIRDILWAIVFKRFRFGIASRLEAHREEIAASRGNTFVGSVCAFLLILIRSVLVKLKGKAIRLLSLLLTWIIYPIFWFGRYEGRSLLVLARLRD